jgi:hypothetical protein
MTIDEQTIILDLMRKNKFELKNSESSAFRFQKLKTTNSLKVI